MTAARRNLRSRVVRALLVAAGLLLVVGAALTWIARGPWVSAPGRVATREASQERLRQAVRFLSEDCQPRNHREIASLDRAGDWIGAELRAIGLEPDFQEYVLREGTFRNVVARRPGSEPDAGLIVLGAHYDAYLTTPGADDNASGVACLLELARVTQGLSFRRPLVLAFFSTEEPPFFGTEDMGSARFVRGLVAERVPVAAVVVLDMVGRFSSAPGSQSYPVPGMSFVYPARGDFLAVVGDMGSGEDIALAKRGLLAAGVLPVVSFRAPRSLGWVDLSDHSAFWQHGLPGVLVTDTAALRNRDYHRPGDTWDRLDYDRMALVVRSLEALLVTADEP